MTIRRLSVCVIIAAGAITYWNSLSGPFVFDDQSAILINRQIRQLWPLTDALSPPNGSPTSGRPIVNLSFAVNYAIGGLDVRGYHIANIAFHILSALVLFGIIRLTLTGPKLEPRFGSSADGMALTCALLWMLHPLQTESVDYVSQRTELMMGLFYLLTLYSAIRATRSPRPDRWHAAAVISCLMGMGCKESMVTAPLMVALYDRIFVFDSVKTALKARGALYLGLAASWLELAALATSRTNTVGFSAGTSAWTYLLNQAVMIVRYLRLALWPSSLVLDYGAPRPLALVDVVPQLAIVVSLLIATAIALVRRPMLGFLGAWFFITLAPTSSFVPIVSEVGAERRMYLPLAAVVVLAVLGGRSLLQRLTVRRAGPALGTRRIATTGPPKGGHHRRPAVVTALAVILMASTLAWATVRRNAEYSSRVSILRTVVERWPHGRAHFNLAVALRMAGPGNSDEAVAHLRLAIPDNPEARYALGSELYDRGQFDEAIAELREFVRQNPKHLDVLASRNLIALSLAQQGKLPEAAAELAGALKTTPQDPDLHANYAFVLMRQNDFAGAVRHYEESLKYRPNNAFALTNLGIAYSAMRQPDKARGYFRQAVAVDPSNASARVELVKALVGQRDFEGAVMHAVEAIRLTPNDPFVYNLAGVAYASQEKLAEAIEYFRQAVALNPNFVEARNNLAAAEAMTRAPKASK